MSPKTEGLQLTVTRVPVKGAVLNPKTLLVNLGRSIRGTHKETVVIPRLPGPMRNGDALTADEVGAVEMMVTPLINRFPSRARNLHSPRPGDPNIYPVAGSIKVERVREATGLRRAFGARTTRVSNVTKTYEKVRTNRQEVPQRAPSDDPEVVKATQNALQRLAQEGIYAPYSYVEQQVLGELPIVEDSFRSSGINHLTGDAIPRVLSTLFKGLEHLPITSRLHPLNAFRELAKEGELYTAVTGRSHDVGAVGTSVGIAEEYITARETAEGKIWLDILTGLGISLAYKDGKFPPYKVFGNDLDIHAISRLLIITGVFPFFPSILSYETAESLGKYLIGTDLKSEDPAIRREARAITADIAQQAEVARWSDLNGGRLPTYRRHPSVKAANKKNKSS